MKKTLMLVLILFVTGNMFAQNKTIYDFKVKTLEGEEFDFASLKGKKILIVNTASKCGYTPQYAQLQEMYKKYGGDKFTIIGFPSNDFLKQEPGNAAEIRQFCTKNYGVTFPIMEKIKVKGKEKHELYKWLTLKQYNKFLDSKVKWNFQKYLIDEKGNLIAKFSSSTKPLDEEIISYLK